MIEHPTYQRPQALEFIPNRFKGHVVGITGAGNKDNLGYAAAERLIKEGVAGLALYDIQGEMDISQRLEDLAQQKGIAKFSVMDVTNLKSVQERMREPHSYFGRLDAIINCAGISGDTGKTIEETDPDIFRQIVEVNFFGSYNITRTIIPLMKQQGYGRILLVDSIAGVDGNPKMAGYCTSKFGVSGLIVGTGQELAAYRKENSHTDININ